MKPTSFKIFQPPQILQPFVQYFYELDTTGNAESRKTLRIIADGCPGIMFQERSTGKLQVNDQILPDAFLFGQSTRYADMLLEGRFKTIGVCFYPNALQTIFGLNAEELTDSCLDLDLFSKRKTGVLSDRLRSAPTAGQQIDVLSSYLIAGLKDHFDNTEKSMPYVLEKIVRSGGTVPLKTLQDQLGLSERSLERRFKNYTGIAPKLFSRICCFQSSLKQLNKRNFDRLSDLAYAHNYADQSHFIRSFKEFAGVSPCQFQKRSSEVIENLTELRA